MSLGAGALKVSGGSDAISREEVSMATLEAGTTQRNPSPGALGHILCKTGPIFPRINGPNMSQLLKNISQVSTANDWAKIMFLKFCISNWPWNIKPFHFNTFFCCERHDLSCSHSINEFLMCENKVLSCMWRYHFFRRKLTWYFICGDKRM